MDPRYEDDIDEIVKGMGDREFTARKVTDTLKRMRAGEKHLPSSRKVGEYLRTNPMVEKVSRERDGNHYMYKTNWDVNADATSTAGTIPTEFTSTAPPNAMALSELQAAMKKMEECEHDWRYQPPAEVCHKCTAFREIEEEDTDAVKTVLEYMRGILASQGPDKLYKLYRNEK